MPKCAHCQEPIESVNNGHVSSWWIHKNKNPRGRTMRCSNDGRGYGMAGTYATPPQET